MEQGDAGGQQMSPEEAAEAQKKNCIFCHIIQGQVQSKKVYEDDSCIGILDINPANPGHVLLLPKEHHSIMPQMPDEDVRHLFKAAKAISVSLLKAVGAEGTNIFVANGMVAGQKAPHVMVHLIPRKKGDGITAFDASPKKATSEELAQVAARLRPRVYQMMGKEPPQGKGPEQQAPEQQEGPKEEPAQSAVSGEKTVDAEFTEKEEPDKGPETSPPEKQAGADLDDIAKVLFK